MKLEVRKRIDPIIDKSFRLQKGAENLSVATRIGITAERAAKIIIDNSLTPYECMADILRHGFHIIISAWDEQIKDPELRAAWAEERTLQTYLNEQASRQKVKQIVQLAGRIIRFHLDEKEVDRVEEVLAGITERLQGITDPYWNRRYTKEYLTNTNVRAAIKLIEKEKPESEVLEWFPKLDQ